MPVCPTEKSHVPAILTVKNCSHLWTKAATVCMCFHMQYTSLRQKIILFLSFICVSKVSKQSHEHHKFSFPQINSPRIHLCRQINQKSKQFIQGLLEGPSKLLSILLSQVGSSYNFCLLLSVSHSTLLGHIQLQPKCLVC